MCIANTNDSQTYGKPQDRTLVYPQNNTPLYRQNDYVALIGRPHTWRNVLNRPDRMTTLHDYGNEQCGYEGPQYMFMNEVGWILPVHFPMFKVKTLIG
jgi:hypothetical protein